MIFCVSVISRISPWARGPPGSQAQAKGENRGLCFGSPKRDLKASPQNGALLNLGISRVAGDTPGVTGKEPGVGAEGAAPLGAPGSGGTLFPAGRTDILLHGTEQ